MADETLEVKENHMYIKINSNHNTLLKDCLPVTYDMQTNSDGVNEYVTFLENKPTVTDYKFKAAYGNEEEDKYEVIDNIVRTSSSVVFSDKFNVNLRYSLRPETDYYLVMQINRLSENAQVNEYSNNLFVGHAGLSAIELKSTTTEKNGIYTYMRNSNYIGSDIYPVNVLKVALSTTLKLGHKYRLSIRQVSGPICRFGITFFDETGTEKFYYAESTSKSESHVLEFDIEGLQKDMTAESAYIRIEAADSASEPIEFTDIQIQDYIGYYADKPCRIQFWSEQEGGYYEVPSSDFKDGNQIKFKFTTPATESSHPSVIRLINRVYKNETSDIDLLVTPYSDEVANMKVQFINHVATDSTPKVFDLMNTEIYKFSELEIQYPTTTRYIRMNKDPESNILGLTSVEYIDSSRLIYAKNMFRSCWTLTDVKFIGSTDRITDMTDMFAMCGEMVTVPETLVTSGCIIFDRMFDYCVKLTTLPENFDTSRAISMKAMFRGCRELTKLPDALNTSKVTNMREFVAYCQKLDTIPNLDTSSCTNLKRAFLGCKGMTTLPWLDTSHIESMEQICKDCELLGSIGDWETGHIKNFREAFSGCGSLTTTPNLNTSSAVIMEAMFKDCAALTVFPAFNYTNCKNIKEMFSGCISLMGDYTWQYKYLELLREPYIVTVVQEITLPEGSEQPAKIPVRDEEGNILVTDDGKVVYEYELDAEGNIQYDETNTPIYKYERDENGNIVMTNIQYNVIYEARYNETLGEFDTNDYGSEGYTGNAPIEGCIDPDEWWNKWDIVVENGELKKIPHFIEYKDCFKDCDSIYNISCMPEVWNEDYDEENSGLVYVYECTYITTGVTQEIKVIHKYFEVKTLEDMKELGEKIKKYFELKQFTTMVTCRLLYTYRLPYAHTKENKVTA